MDFIFVLLLGLLWGSFANVCIVRLPENKGVISGRSSCPKCKKKISWYDNIPVISYMLLRGKCRICNKEISTQYLIVELLIALFFLIEYFYFGLTLTTVLLFILTLALIIIFFIDLKHFIIPDVVTFPLMIIGFLKSFDPNLNEIFPNYINSLIGGCFGYGIIWGVIFFYKKFKNKEGMGLGDAKLLSAIGFWFGWISIPFILFFSSFAALIFAVPGLLNKSKNMSSQIPFGPYIILGCVLYLLLLEQIIKYLN